MNIFVGSLPFRLAEAELRELFEAYGEVSSARIITDKFSGKSRGFGFVEMPDDAEAQKAIDELNNSQVGGRTIVVNKSVERKEGEGGERRRPSGDQRGGGYGSDRRSGGGYHR